MTVKKVVGDGFRNVGSPGSTKQLREEQSSLNVVTSPQVNTVNSAALLFFSNIVVLLCFSCLSFLLL